MSHIPHCWKSHVTAQIIFISARKNKKKIIEFDRALSPVYRNKRAPPGPIKGQVTYFYLAPLPPIEHDDHEDKKETTELERKNIPPPISATPPLINVTSTGSSDNEFTSSTSSTPLPIFNEKFLMRKPCIKKAEPLKKDDELFIAFYQMTQLRPLVFQKTADSYKFYGSNFPLILEKLIDEERSSTPSSRRTLTPPMDIMIKRRLILNKRLTDLEEMMDAMEKETEDTPFKTELNGSVFDPTKWPFAKIDPAGMRRRYTIDATLKEINK